MSLYVIFYHRSNLRSADNVKILSVCTHENASFNIIKQHFYNFGENINGTISCAMKDDNAQCVMWINKYAENMLCEYDKSFIQPNGSFSLASYINNLI